MKSSKKEFIQEKINWFKRERQEFIEAKMTYTNLFKIKRKSFIHGKNKL